jgi:membrane-bound ClpP family serine protease
MTLIIALFIVGALLLATEVFVPGGILGILGAVSLVAGVVLAFIEKGVVGGWIAIGAAVVLVVLMLWFEIKVLPKTALGRRLFLSASIDGASQQPLAARDTVVGQEALADTMLAPSGYVVVGGKRYEAYSRSGLIAKGEALRVVGLDNFRLIVQKN